MTWMKFTKQLLGSVVIISSILMCQQQAIAKKVEPEKPSLTVAGQASQQAASTTSF